MNPIYCHATVTYFYRDNQGNLDSELKTSRVTFASHPPTPQQETTWAAAWCLHTDNFSRKLGRSRAAGRLNSPEHSHTVTPMFDTYIDFWQQVFAEALQEGVGPCRWSITGIEFTHGVSTETAQAHV